MRQIWQENMSLRWLIFYCYCTNLNGFQIFYSNNMYIFYCHVTSLSSHKNEPKASFYWPFSTSRRRVLHVILLLFQPKFYLQNNSKCKAKNKAFSSVKWNANVLVVTAIKLVHVKWKSNFFVAGKNFLWNLDQQIHWFYFKVDESYSFFFLAYCSSCFFFIVSSCFCA